MVADEVDRLYTDLKYGNHLSPCHACFPLSASNTFQKFRKASGSQSVSAKMHSISHSGRFQHPLFFFVTYGKSLIRYRLKGRDIRGSPQRSPFRRSGAGVKLNYNINASVCFLLLEHTDSSNSHYTAILVAFLFFSCSVTTVPTTVTAADIS